MNYFSIAIPTHDYYGLSNLYLNRLLQTILIQEYKDFNVTISDQSTNKDVYYLCKKYDNLLQINYFTGTPIGNSTKNINNALEKSDGYIVKPMFMDDFFYRPDALNVIKKYIDLKKEYTWGLCSTNHFIESSFDFHRFLRPYIHPDLIYGVNTMGCPSVSFYKKENEILFDENLRYLVDTEWYYSWNKKYGRPIIIDETIISTSQGDISTSVSIQQEDSFQSLVEDEKKYCLNKHMAAGK